MYLSIQLSKAKKQAYKNRLMYLSEKSAKSVLQEKVNSTPDEQLISAAKYGYNFHMRTPYTLWAFEKDCLENFLQHIKK